jgi:hypothetical protein
MIVHAHAEYITSYTPEIEEQKEKYGRRRKRIAMPSVVHTWWHKRLTNNSSQLLIACHVAEQ